MRRSLGRNGEMKDVQSDTGRWRSFAATAALACALLVATGLDAGAQKATEIYIPIGMSPGISGIRSEIGEIVSFDAETRILTLRNDDGEHTATLTDDTYIWLDRSARDERNVEGTVEAFEPGRRCEVKYVYDGTTRLGEAEWIKVEPEP